MLSNISQQLVAKLSNRPNLKKIIENIGWLSAEKILRMVLGLLVSVLLARYLGPTNFGIISFAISLVVLLSSFIHLGLGGLVVRDILNFPEQQDVTLGTTFTLKIICGLVIFLSIGTLCFYDFFEYNESWVIFFVSTSLIFRPFETIDFWFQSRVRVKFSVYAKSLAFIVASVVNIILIFIKAPLVAFAVVYAVEVTLEALFLVLLYSRINQSILKWRAKLPKAKELLSQSWMLILSGLFATVYLKIDQIMLKFMIGNEEVGIYAIAAQLSEAWYFLPSALAMSVYPALIKCKKVDEEVYRQKLQNIFDILFASAFIVALVVTFTSGPLIKFLYGDTFLRSSQILKIHIWAGIFIFMRALFSKWIIIENLLYFSLMSHALGATVNVLLNFMLINKYAGMGASVATLISYSVASYFMLFICAQTRPVAKMMTKSLLLPFRATFFCGRMLNK